MTTSTLDDPETRLELEKYFDFVAKYADSEGADEDIVRTLKAGSFLLIYNFVEASIRRGIAAIFSKIDAHKVSFDSLTLELKRVAFLNHSNIPKDFCENVQSFAHDYIRAGFDSNELFSGNLDARKIREVAKRYGFSSRTDHSVTRGGSKLETVKNMRNDLAHGLKTFREVGRDYSASELIQLKSEVVHYITSILSNIDTFLDQQQYLKPTPSVTKI